MKFRYSVVSTDGSCKEIERTFDAKDRHEARDIAFTIWSMEVPPGSYHTRLDEVKECTQKER